MQRQTFRNSTNDKQTMVQPMPIPVQIVTKFGNKTPSQQTDKKYIQTKKINHQIADSAKSSQNTDFSLHNMVLQNLILVSEGKNMYMHDPNISCNFYFICRVFWHSELKSKICWNTNNPMFGYQQVSTFSYCLESGAESPLN